MLQVSTLERDEATTIQLVGRLDGQPCCQALNEQVKAAVASGPRRIVVDLEAVEWVSSCGIGCLVASFASVQRAGGTMALRAPNRRVLQTLTVTCLVPSVFEVIESYAHAQADGA